MIEKSVGWCRKKKIPIQAEYENLRNVVNIQELKFRFFPVEKGVNVRNLQITTESIYSVTLKDDAERISKLIKKYYPDAKSIVDTSANVGGNSINFAKHFEKVTSIEIDPETYEALQHNLDLYQRKNVEVILGDYTELKDQLKADVYFFDPPWGGIYYKLEKTIDLFLSNINIIDILPRNFVLKAPMNYNLEGLLQKYKNLNIFHFRSYLVIIPNWSDNQLLR